MSSVVWFVAFVGVCGGVVAWWLVVVLFFGFIVRLGLLCVGL